MIFKVKNKQKLSIGIYIILNTKNGKNYVGSTMDSFYKRYRTHVADLLKNGHHSDKLQNAYNKYGNLNFEFRILEVLNKDVSMKTLLKKEQYYIDYYSSDYNICKYPKMGGKPNLHRKLSKTWKNKIKMKSLLYKHNNDTLKKVTFNNKNNSTKLEFKSDRGGSLHFKSWVSAAEYFNCHRDTLRNCYNNNRKYKNRYTIIKKSNQRTSIKVYCKNKILRFRSLNNCDKFFKKWRGYTSTLVLKKELILEKYKYKVYKDIV